MSFMVFVRDLIFAAAMVLLPLAISLTAAQADPLFIHYECDLAAPSSTDMSPCPTNPGPRDTVYKVLTGTPDPSNPDRLLCPETGSGSFCAARSSVGNAVAPVSAWGKCYWIDNHSTRNLFVPFRTETEWSSFISSAQSGQLGNIVLTPCTPPSSDGSGTITIGPPYDQCNSATIHTPPVYGRYNSSIWPVPENTSPDTPAFTCHNGATSVQSLLQYNAGDPSASGDAQMLWTPDFIFSPDLNLTATDGISIGTSISVNSGEAVALSWTTGSDPNPLYTSQTYSCAATDSLSAYWSSPFQGVVATQASPNGAVVLTPPGTSVYTLTCTNSKALISKSTVTVNVSGACGNAASQTFTSPPSSGLCLAGDTASAVTTNATTYSWTCTPPQGGIPQSCYANRNVCTPNWTTTNVGACSVSCGGGTQTVTQSDGCGNTQQLTQSCNTQSCPPPTGNGGKCAGLMFGTECISATSGKVCTFMVLTDSSGNYTWNYVGATVPGCDFRNNITCATKFDYQSSGTTCQTTSTSLHCWALLGTLTTDPPSLVSALTSVCNAH